MIDRLAITETAMDMKLDGRLRSAKPRIAILIPCYNEELTIAEVVAQFRAELPDADIYVFDNNSTDRTVEEARAAGALIFHEKRQGKGYVVQSMFRKVSADVYVMVDGDGTYPAAEVHRLIEPVLNDEADIVVGSRLHRDATSQFKTPNRLGNRFFLYVLNYTLGARITDMLSGYRAFNRGFVKGVPLFGGGFETETELTIKALNRGFRIVEVPVNLTTRPEGSFSKIRIFRDGFLILNMHGGMLHRSLDPVQENLRYDRIAEGNTCAPRLRSARRVRACRDTPVHAARCSAPAGSPAPPHTQK